MWGCSSEANNAEILTGYPKETLRHIYGTCDEEHQGERMGREVLSSSFPLGEKFYNILSFWKYVESVS